jgi:DNA-binding transcriptional LysR family regulator
MDFDFRDLEVGVALLSARAKADDVAAGRIHTCCLHGVPLQRRFALVRDRRRAPTPLARALHRFLRADGECG